MINNPTQKFRAAFAAYVLVTLAAEASGQNRPGRTALPPEPSMFESVWLYAGILAVAGLVGLVLYRRRKEKDAASKPAAPAADREFKLTYKETPREAAKPKPLPVKKTEPVKPAAPLKFTELPVSGFTKLSQTNAFPHLPVSADMELLKAIELTNEESEADLTARAQVLNLLSTFKTSNSVFAICQIALYDLSTKLRADAVAVLSEIDHESVFETIVTACADPTREVRAAAARALFKITFDRGQAWARIVESGDLPRMRHAARCAIDSDLVKRSFDRLVHTDRAVAYEAFALTALLILSGETEPIFKTLTEHRDENVKLALLHVLQTVKDENTFDGLSSLLTTSNLTPNIAAKVNEVRSCLQMTWA